MKKIILFFVFAILLVLTLSLVQAKLTAGINVKSSFQVGERATFDYSIVSDKDAVISYYSSIMCPNYLLPLLDEKTISLKANEPFYGTDDSGLVFEEPIEPQTCKAIVKITSPETEAKEFYNPFKIIAKQSFDVKILACKDVLCKHQSRIFVSGEPIYIQIKTEKNGRTITSNVVASYETPSFNSVPLEINNKRTSFNLDESGNYNIEVVASNSGYKTMNKKIQIGIIEKEAHIGSIEQKSNVKPATKSIYASIVGRITEIFKLTGSVIFNIFEK